MQVDGLAHLHGSDQIAGPVGWLWEGVGRYVLDYVGLTLGGYL